MSVIVENIPGTQLLQPHELRVLYELRQRLDAAGEEGFLIPGKFESKERELGTWEIDGILVLPHLILLLELKSRYAERITLMNLNDVPQLFEPGKTAARDDPDGNPLAKLIKASGPIGKRVRDQSRIQAYVYPIYVASPSHNGSLTLEIGPQRHPWSIYDNLAACTPPDFLKLLGAIRQRHKIPAPRALSENGRANLLRLRDAVMGLPRKKPPRERQIGAFIVSLSPYRSEPETTLYEGYEQGTDSPVWVKAYHKDVLATGEAAQFEQTLRLREAIALDQFGDHDNIARYKTNLEDAEYVYVFVKREPGKFLNELMRAGQLTRMACLRILSDILTGLAYIHQHKEGRYTALYRDLRPESVFVRKDRPAQLFNFDCSRIPGRGTVREYAQAQAERWKFYASYELLNSSYADDLDTSTDIYSWSVVAYELLARRRPYSTVEAAAGERFPSLASQGVTLRGELAALIERGLARDPDRRPLLNQIRVALDEAIHGGA